MRQRFYKIIVVCFLTGWLGSANAQVSFSEFSSNRLQASVVYPEGINLKPIARTIFSNYDSSHSVKLYVLRQLPLLREDHYSRNFGFFCRKELQFEKQTRVALRFRLGSLEYCNYLEDKR